MRSGNARPDKKHDLIMQAELLESHFNNAYDAVSSLRSNWLQARGSDSFRTPSVIWVYFNSTKLGGVETLSAIPVAQLSYIQHFGGVDATVRWGVGHSAGVIYVSTHPIAASSALR
jgi:hypothetical protein